MNKRQVIQDREGYSVLKDNQHITHVSSSTMVPEHLTHWLRKTITRDHLTHMEVEKITGFLLLNAKHTSLQEEGYVLNGPSVRESPHSKLGTGIWYPSAELQLHNPASHRLLCIFQVAK